QYEVAIRSPPAHRSRPSGGSRARAAKSQCVPMRHDDKDDGIPSACGARSVIVNKDRCNMESARDTNGPDLDAVRDKYRRERAKRITEGRGVIHNLRDPSFAEYLRDPFTPFVHREPITDDVDVAIVGAGMSGVVVGARLREAGVRRILLIDRAGGI